jgi:hypothetical protein
MLVVCTPRDLNSFTSSSRLKGMTPPFLLNMWRRHVNQVSVPHFVDFNYLWSCSQFISPIITSTTDGGKDAVSQERVLDSAVGRAQR